MAPSQLKSLKASLRTQGVLGPSKSKKEKKRGSKDRTDKKIGRNEALAEIREQYNPFEAKYLARGPKYEFAGAQQLASRVVGRPGVTKGMGEEIRRNTLLKEMHRRRKVGGLVDRRFGEDDPSMGPEEKALARFIQEKERGIRKSGIFDLEDDDGEAEELTHLGQSLFSGAQVQDDFDDGSLQGSDQDTDVEGTARGKKRQKMEVETRQAEPGLEAEGEALPEKPRTKQEVMKEVMAKSKLYKYERQQAKEDDDELRAELDEGLQDIYSYLRSGPKKEAPPKQETPIQPEARSEPQMNPDRAALLNGKSRAVADREYDARMRQMTFDARSKPTEKTKTEEERATEEAARLKDLEAQRLRRMAGDEDKGLPNGGEADHEDIEDESHILGGGIPVKQRKELDVEDEDDFLLEDDLVASDPSEDEDDDEVSENSSQNSNDPVDGGDDLEFLAGILPEDALRDANAIRSNGSAHIHGTENAKGLAYTYPCPSSQEDLLAITADTSPNDLPVLIQRIRLLYDPKLAAENKSKLASFAAILVEHIPHLTSQTLRPTFSVLEALIRHIHSLAKSFPLEVATAYREHLTDMHKNRPLALNTSDLIVLSGIGTTFSTSDHFHQVATPAMMTIARYLGQKIPRTLPDLAKGLFLCSLSLQYQRLAKRYIPEVVNYLLNAMQMLAPVKPSKPFGDHPSHEDAETLRIAGTGSPDTDPPLPDFWLVESSEQSASAQDQEQAKTSLLCAAVRLAALASDLWQDKPSFPEIFAPFSTALSHLRSSKCSARLPTSVKSLLTSTLSTLTPLVSRSLSTRTPLALHNHRPRPIKTSVPKFEESFRPDKRYDPDRQRAEAARLRAEHKREHKGALRELRKDSAFVARESLKEKKATDRAYDEKFRRLVASINEEGGRDGNEYERERRTRKGKGKR